MVKLFYMGNPGSSRAGLIWEIPALLGILLIFSLVSAGPLLQPIFGDEIPIINNLIHFVKEKTIIPTQFSYPTFYSYVASLSFSSLALVASLAGGSSLEEIGLKLIWSVYGTSEATTELILLRVISLVIGVGTIIATYALGIACYANRFGVANGRLAGLISASLIAFTYTLVYRSTLALPDVLPALLAALALKLSLDVINRNPLGSTNQKFPPKYLLGAAVLTVKSIRSIEILLITVRSRRVLPIYIFPSG